MSSLPAMSTDVTIGVILIGLAVTSSLFGVSTSQARWYCRHYPHDRILLRVLVAIVWSMDACHLMLYSATMWSYLVDKKFAVFGQTALPWTANVQILCNACVVVVIQSFYVFRIIALGKSLVLGVVLALFVMADFGVAITLFTESIKTDSVADSIKLQAFDIALSTVTAITDVVLSATLVVLLIRSRTGSSRSNRLINKLLFYTINTGLLTSFCAVLSLILVLVSPTTSIYVMFYYIGAHLYSVSLLATLNARAGLRAQVDDAGHSSALSQFADILQRITPLPFPVPASRPLQRRPSPYMWNRSPSQLIVVAVQRDTVVTFDCDEEVDVTEHDRKDGPADVGDIAQPPSTVRLHMHTGHTGALHAREQTESWVDASEYLSSPDVF
ncbi:hypothetical protein C8Q73DRAFT_27693 [Cubamyces lactineus]|nr:hypothetical protein C8Q73DRAFT_27693 [Cubamyces lactineus]